MNQFSFLNEVKESSVLPCYFIHGEEEYLARMFIKKLKNELVKDGDDEFGMERFRLEEKSWMDIIDSARSMPFFLTSWRIIWVQISKEAGQRLSSSDAAILKDYLAEPPKQTLLVVTLAEKIRKTSPLLKFFSSFPKEQIGIREVKPLYERQIGAWIDRMLAEYGKRASQDAKNRLQEFSGNDLGRLSNEIEKIVTFIGEKNTIELDDVNQVSGWVKSFIERELTECLEQKDFNRSLLVLDNLIRKEGSKPEFIIGIVAKFLRDIYQAKLWIREQSKSRKEIFKVLRPYILESFGDLYRRKFEQLFSSVERLTWKELDRLVGRLEGIDLKNKTSDFPPQVLLEDFLFDYCAGRGTQATWKVRD